MKTTVSPKNTHPESAGNFKKNTATDQSGKSHIHGADNLSVQSIYASSKTNKVASLKGYSLATKTSQEENYARQAAGDSFFRTSLIDSYNRSLGASVHTNDTADSVTRLFGANAVTVDDTVYFAQGKYQPSTLEGQELFAHELHHVHHGKPGTIYRDVDPEYLQRMRYSTDEQLQQELALIDDWIENNPVILLEADDWHQRRRIVSQVMQERGLLQTAPTTDPVRYGQRSISPQQIEMNGNLLTISPNAYTGISFYGARRIGPPRPGATGVHRNDQIRIPAGAYGEYLINAQTRNHNSADREVIYLNAYSVDRSRVEWLIGPDSLPYFIQSAESFAQRCAGPDVDTGTGQPRVLPAAPAAFEGVALHYIVESVPQTEGVPTRFNLTIGDFLLAPNCVYDSYGCPFAVFYIAMHRRSRILAYFVGPENVDDFINNLDRYTSIGGFAFMFGYPSPHQIESARAMHRMLMGDVGGAFVRIGRAWKEAVQDPNWWFQMATAVAGAAGRASTPVRRPPPQLSVVRTSAQRVTSTAAPAATVTPSNVTPIRPGITPGTPAAMGSGGSRMAVGGGTVPQPVPATVTSPAPLRGLPTNPNPTPLMNPGSPLALPASGIGIMGIQGAAGTTNQPVSPTSLAPAPQTAPTQNTNNNNQNSTLFRLILPPQKSTHARLYQGLVAQRRLINERPYVRGNPAQASKWDRMMHPRRGTGIHQTVWDRGERMGLTERQILRPTWSRRSLYDYMEVDHIVELQVTPVHEREIWNSAVNYELLDQSSNGSSGTQLDNNIQSERTRLFNQTGNPMYLNQSLVFDTVVVQGGSSGERWLADDIRIGDHLDSFRDLGGA